MGKKYIVEIGRLERLYKASVNGNGKPNMTWLSPEVDLTPYTEPNLEQVRKEAYEKGLSDAWDAARKVSHCALWDDYRKDTGKLSVYTGAVLDYYTASEALEEIRAYEQAQKEKEEQEEKDSVTTEEVMRQYLDTFCKRNFCTKCLLHTPDFTCGRGYHFLTKNPVSDEEVRRAYAKVVKE